MGLFSKKKEHAVPADLQTAKGMYEFCLANETGHGFNEKWALKHFGVIESSLMAGEKVLMAFIGMNDYGAGGDGDNFAYAVTNKRFILGNQRLVGNSSTSIDLSKINDVSVSNGALISQVVIDSLGEIVHVGVSKKEGPNIVRLFHEALEQNRTVSAAPVAGTSQADELMKFKQLLDSGVITQEEFDKKKNQLLGV